MIVKFSRQLFSGNRIFQKIIFKHKLISNFCSKSVLQNVYENIKYFLILDFEATCEKKTKIDQEIIEFPCIKVNVSNLQEEARFHHYVKPVINPTLSYFCTELTGILQEMVENEPTFPTVLQKFENWREQEGLTDENSLYVTSGDWDLGHMMPRQCELSSLTIPPHFTEWADIKKIHIDSTDDYAVSLIQIIKYYGLEFEGRQHSGIVDCLNILNVIREMVKSNIKIEPTAKLINTVNGRKVWTLKSKFRSPFQITQKP